MTVPVPREYPTELRERAMRLVAEARKEDSALSLNVAVVRIEQRVGVNADALRGWCKQAAIDAGERSGPPRSSNSPRSPGCTGSTRTGCTHRSDTSHPSRKENGYYREMTSQGQPAPGELARH